METWSQGLVSECQHSFAQHKAEQGIGSTYKNHTASAQGYQHFGFNSPGVCPASLHSTLLHLFFIFYFFTFPDTKARYLLPLWCSQCAPSIPEHEDREARGD